MMCLACTKTPGNNSGEQLDPSNLSSGATANCYLIDKAGSYHFKAGIAGNGIQREGCPQIENIEAAQASLVWESEQGMIEDLVMQDGEIHFSATQSGNALIAANNEKGDILWSWHIWFPEEQPQDILCKSGSTMLNMNLGALRAELGEEDDVKPYGLLYQWGRKDPFPSAPGRTGDTSTTGFPIYNKEGEEIGIQNSSWYELSSNTLDFSIAHPTVCISNYAQYSSSRDWLAAEYSNDKLWGEEKTIFDPCPVGYRVSSDRDFNSFTLTGAYTANPEEFDVEDLNADGIKDAMDYKFGWYFNTEKGSSFFPAAARYDGSYAMLMGSKSGLWGSYWSCNVRENSMFQGGASVALSFMNEGSVLACSATASAAKADAYSVRCVKE